MRFTTAQVAGHQHIGGKCSIGWRLAAFLEDFNGCPPHFLGLNEHTVFFRHKESIEHIFLSLFQTAGGRYKLWKERMNLRATARKGELGVDIAIAPIEIAHNVRI